MKVLTENGVTMEQIRDAWKNPKQRELKVVGYNTTFEQDYRCMEKSQAKGIERIKAVCESFEWKEDAWKNPKQRELKACEHDFPPVCFKKMHGKIPSKGN